MRRGAGTALAIALALGGHQYATASPPDFVPAAADEPPPGFYYVDLPEATSRYVALGDSYSAGEGLGGYERGSGDYPEDDCHRSIYAYSRRLVFDPGIRTEVHACSGARVRHIFDEVQTTAGGRTANLFGLQVNPETLGPDVGLITATIGGNDANFSAVLNTCATSADCLDQPYVTDGTRYDSLRQWTTQFLTTYPLMIEDMASRLRTGAPNARILLIGYPHLFPLFGVLPATSPTCSLALGDNPGGFGFDQEEQSGINTLVDALNSATNTAALRSDVEFLAPTEHWIGHVPCAFGGPQWTNFVDVQVGLPPSLRRSSFHPNFDGHREYARLIGCYFQAYPKPNDPDEFMESRTPAVGGWLIGVPLPCDAVKIP